MVAPKVRIVTDSTADLPRGLVQELDITVVPLNVHFGNEVYQDGVDLSPQQFMDKLRRGPSLPTTSQPSAGLFEETYRSLAPAPVVSVHIAAGLSGTLNSARLAVENLKGKARVAILDSQNTSIGLGLLAVLAARAAHAGATQEDIVRLIEERVDRVRFLAMLDTLEFLRRGGRIGPTSAFLGSLLSIKPIICVRGGQVLPLEKVRTQARGLQRLVELSVEAAPYEEMAVLHVCNPQMGGQLRDLLQREYRQENVLLAEAGAIIATHGGPGAVGIAGVRH